MTFHFSGVLACTRFASCPEPVGHNSLFLFWSRNGHKIYQEIIYSFIQSYAQRKPLLPVLLAGQGGGRVKNLSIFYINMKYTRHWSDPANVSSSGMRGLALLVLVWRIRPFLATPKPKAVVSSRVFHLWISIPLSWIFFFSQCLFHCLSIQLIRVVTDIL